MHSVDRLLEGLGAKSANDTDLHVSAIGQSFKRNVVSRLQPQPNQVRLLVRCQTQSCGERKPFIAEEKVDSVDGSCIGKDVDGALTEIN